MKSQEKLKKKKGMRLAFKLSLTVSIPLLLITLIGIAISAGKRNRSQCKRGLHRDGRWCRFCDERRYTEKGK